MNQEHILKLIVQERQRQDEKWGVQNHDPCKWLTILMEEVGEASKGAREHSAIRYMEELIHSAAVAVAAIECLYRQHEQQENEATRDPESPCEGWRPGKPEGRCETDGHYRCKECAEMDPDKEDEYGKVIPEGDTQQGD